jgi:hypothetical protein
MSCAGQGITVGWLALVCSPQMTRASGAQSAGSYQYGYYGSSGSGLDESTEGTERKQAHGAVSNDLAEVGEGIVKIVCSSCKSSRPPSQGSFSALTSAADWE